MKSGIYAIASLDESPIGHDDLGTLGLSARPGPHERQSRGFAVHAVDREELGRAVHFLANTDVIVVLLGHLDEPEELAGILGMPTEASAAELAIAALDRFGAEAPRRMLGEWSLLRWRPAGRELTALASEACRDAMFFATDGRRVAIAPELWRLARLDWVGRAFDPDGLVLQLSRARLRRLMTGETFLRKVRRVVPGTREIFGTRRSAGVLHAPLQPDAWGGSFEDAMAALEHLLRRIVGQNLSRHGKAAFLLSGGLDSSLLGWLGSAERRQAQEMFFLTSIAPSGSGLPDEKEFSKAVADCLGIAVTFIYPPQGASVYLPSAQMFAWTELPVASPRHYLYDALYGAASAQDAEVLFDGVYGELTVTNPVPLATPDKTWRQRLRKVRARWAGERDRLQWPTGAFHARVSQTMLNALPREWEQVWRAPYPNDPEPRGDARWGFRAAIRKNAMIPSAAAGARFRHLMPYRDGRLLRLMASMPARYLYQGGMNRAVARTLLKGRVPDFVRLRVDGRPFSPDYVHRIRTQARDVLAHLESFRAAGAEEWLDLGWLEGALSRVEAGRLATNTDYFEVQATTVAASFFVWWKEQTRG